MPADRACLTRAVAWSSILTAFAAPASALDDWLPLPTGVVHRIAFGSCAKQWEPQPIWTAVVAVEPDLFVFLGDNIYGDFDGEKPFIPTRESLEADWAKLAAKPELQAVREHVPFMATWDNHDYGKHDGGAEFALKQKSKQVFLDFFGEPTASSRRTRPGIYDARVFGPEGRRVQVILLDNRWFRGPLVPDTRTSEERKALGVVGSMGHTPNRDPAATLLGEAQWTWLEQQLRAPAEVRIIASGTQVISDHKGMQEWGNFPLERKRLFDLIARTGAHGVILLSGNVHFAEVSRTDEGPYPVYDFTASGMTHVSAAYAEVPNPYRVAGPFAALNFGLLDIDWEAEPAPEIILQARDLDGRVAFEHRVSLDALRP